MVGLHLTTTNQASCITVVLLCHGSGQSMIPIEGPWCPYVQELRYSLARSELVQSSSHLVHLQKWCCHHLGSYFHQIWSLMKGVPFVALGILLGVFPSESMFPYRGISFASC
jgi:hypothetical protein